MDIIINRFQYTNNINQLGTKTNTHQYDIYLYFYTLIKQSDIYLGDTKMCLLTWLCNICIYNSSGFRILFIFSVHTYIKKKKKSDIDFNLYHILKVLIYNVI